jgi:hypothetical protein
MNTFDAVRDVSDIKYRHRIFNISAIHWINRRNRISMERHDDHDIRRRTPFE